jgi:hypothetical protein
MSTPELQLLVTHCGMRLRRLAESRDWNRPEMGPLQQLFGEFAAGGRSSVDNLRRLITRVGSRDADGTALQGLSPEHARHFWRGYYGARPADGSGRVTPGL